MGKSRDIRQAVEKELSSDPLVDATGITVKNIDGGVALHGTVPSYPQYLEAAEATRRVAGVTSVHNHLKVELPPGDQRDDALLTTAANHALTADATVPPGVQAAAREGNLTLTGTVRYGSQRAAAEQAVSGLIGVRRVRDEIEVVFDCDEAEVRRLVKKALDRSAPARGYCDVTVNTSGNTVTLIGRVRNDAEREAVVGAAWKGHGVEFVLDELQVTG